MRKRLTSKKNRTADLVWAYANETTPSGTNNSCGGNYQCSSGSTGGDTIGYVNNYCEGNLDPDFINNYCEASLGKNNYCK